MESAPKNPLPEDKKPNDKLRKLGTGLMTGVSIAIAAASPVSKVAAVPLTTNDTVPKLATEKLVVRPKDIEDQVLKDEIEANRAVFEISEEGEIKRIQGKKE